MRLLHYVEIENFKRYGAKQRIELDHPAVLIGPNNCGKTSAIQAIALWAMGIKTWYSERKDSSASERVATGINRLNIVAVPVTNQVSPPAIKTPLIAWKNGNEMTFCVKYWYSLQAEV